MTAPALAPVNMHMHSHFSFNADGLAPAQLAEEAVRRGLYAAAICDFDVLDGLEEFFGAGDAHAFRVAVGMETRVFFPEYADREINSPGEPGVYYFMGMGFGCVPEEGTLAARTLETLREGAAQRNRDLTSRINAAFPEIAIDYDRDVIPLTPSGNATERHIVRAYIEKVRRISNGDAAAQSGTWARALGLDVGKIGALLENSVALQNAVRSKLMKAGGVGYVQPGPSTFPPLEDVAGAILDAGAIPMATWLNGLSAGESDIAAQLDCLRAKGIAALNIVPDRNWNVSDPDERETKVARLHEVVEIAGRMELPLNVGTELNSFGQPFVDDFEAAPMRPLWPAFFHGANVMIGQSRLARYAKFSYCGPEAEAEFGAGATTRNEFFMQAGTLEPPNARTRERLEDMGPDRAFAAIRDSARAGRWIL
ncbi:MAG TPA: PHP domain-containing protein [Sumerlaeia bacterium]|nr:PHP domain-containing protein [Sumerlaeia bacterium]